MSRNTSSCNRQTRRDFIKTSSTAAITAASGFVIPTFAEAENRAASVAIIYDSEEEVVKERPVQWAIGELRAALNARGISIGSADKRTTERIAIVSRSHAQPYFGDEYTSVPSEPEGRSEEHTSELQSRGL